MTSDALRFYYVPLRASILGIIYNIKKAWQRKLGISAKLSYKRQAFFLRERGRGFIGNTG
jgi:hypothetical protein